MEHQEIPKIGFETNSKGLPLQRDFCLMTQPTIIAAGLACLDVMGINSDEAPLLSTGGFPNALIILKTKGWNSIALAGLGADRAGDYVLQEFTDWGVDARFVKRIPDINTPVYVLHHENGGHYYGKECPYCHTRFPLYFPIKPETIAEMLPDLPRRVNLYYFDKVAESLVNLAHHYKELYALTMFEPNRIDDEELFRQSAAASDIMKYSSDRRTGVRTVTDALPIPLEIETAGQLGLHYRVFSNGERSEWRTLPSVAASRFIDAAGAGDWLTASLIDSVGRDNDFYSIIADQAWLEEILCKGQQASADNCSYVGARGSLYIEREMLSSKDFCPFCRGNSKTKDVFEDD